ncbi:MAG: RNA polymerase sigma factor [Chloroflexi bacterium]|nr:RNA polymerase sigma factor [Chloroflexota bacterium]
MTANPEIGLAAMVDSRSPTMADDRPFSELLTARLATSYRLATLILRGQADAEDAVHDAVIRAWQRRHGLRDALQFGAWFDTIVLNVCRDRLRRGRRVRFTPLGEFTVAPSLTGPESMAVTRDQLERAFAEMPFDQRAVVVLRWWADLPVAEIARRLGIPEGTVKSRLHAAMAGLRGAIESAERREDDHER